MTRTAIDLHDYQSCGDEHRAKQMLVLGFDWAGMWHR